MLKSIRLQNFRGFEDHTVEFAQFCLLMGQNNAGKTTIIEALRIVALAQAKAPKANFQPSPDWMAPDLTGPVFTVSLNSIGFEHETAHHQYRKENFATITAVLKNNCQVKVVICAEPGEVFCQLYEAGRKKVMNRRISANPKFGRILVMPPVGHLLLHEQVISDEYLRKNAGSFRSHRHFRNQIYRNPEIFPRFKEVAEASWNQLQIKPIELSNSGGGREYKLTVRDGPFVSEVGQQGSGLQAWLQTLWFLVMAPSASTVVLDEPDVYLHADLQRKLLKILNSLDVRQVVVATHSVEMISDVSCEEVIPVKRRAKSSRPLKTQDDLQNLADQIGSLNNLQLSKISNSGHILFVEGKDKAFLSEIAFKIRPLDYDRFVSVPTFSLNGFDNWPRAAMTAKAFYAASSGRIKCKAVLDSDYKSASDLEKIYMRAKEDNLEITFWKRKEIENYFLSVNSVHKAVNVRSDREVGVDEISDILDSIVLEMKIALPGLVAESVRSSDRSLSVPQALKCAAEIIDSKLLSGLEYLDIVSGKGVITRLSETLNKKFGVSLGPMAICRSLSVEDFDPDLVKVVKSIL